MSTVIEQYGFARINGADVGGIGPGGNKGDTMYVPGLRASTNPVKGLTVQGEIAWELEMCIRDRMMGAYMGNSAINGWGTWKIQSYYKVLERDSWLDALPDDDFYSGDTDVAGWRNQLDIGLAKNVWFTMSYFRTHVYKYFGTGAFSQKAPEDLFQMDLNLKF